MKRRQFLRAVGTVGPATLIGTQAAAGDTTSSASKETDSEPRVFLYDDGRHAGPLYQYEPPLKPADFLATVDQVVDSGVDALVYFAGLEGGVALYDSKVAQKWGDNVTLWKHPVWYRAARHIQQLIADGHDPLKLICDRCDEKGIKLIASNYVALQGNDRATGGGYGRTSDFVYDHPEFQVGVDDDPQAIGAEPTRFSFLHQKLREERFRVFEELLVRYATDGIEINLAEFAPLCRFSETETLKPLLTEWLRNLADTARKAEALQSRRKRIYVRIPCQPQGWKALGYDVETWVRDGLVDGLVCLPGLMDAQMDQDPGVAPAAKLTEGTKCRVVFGFRDGLGRQFDNYAPQAMIWAAAANGYHEGAHGFALVTYHWGPNGWPWTSEDYETLRLLGHPEMLASANKTFRARSAPRGRGSTSDQFGNQGPSLPRTLVEGKPLEVRFLVADDLAAANKEGIVASVQLRVRITDVEPSLNEIQMALNGHPLPDSILQRHDLTYRLYGMGAINPYGCVYEYTLPPDLYPGSGHNVVTVTLTKHDPNISADFSVYDVECAIDYRVHRSFERSPPRS